MVMTKPDVSQYIIDLAGMRFRVEGPGRAVISSMSRPELEHIVEWDHERWVCTCESFGFQKGRCKHVERIKEWLDGKLVPTIVEDE